MTSLIAPRSLVLGEGFRQIASFAFIGTVSTVAYVALYSLMRETMPAGAANVLALLITAVGNTAANRAMTFRVHSRDGLARDHLAGIAALGVAVAITSFALAALDAFYPSHGRVVELAVLVGSNVVATLIRFLLLRLAIARTQARPRLVTRSTATFRHSERTRG